MTFDGRDGGWATANIQDSAPPPPAEHRADGFRAAMRRAASGVAVITTTADGVDHGMTATAFASVSMDPPSLLVVVNKDTSLHGPLRTSGQFCVNILDQDQGAVAQRFASKPSGQARFETGTWQRDGRTPPQLTGAQARISCRLREAMAVGTHVIFVGDVIGSEAASDGGPLLYLNGGYAKVDGRG